MARSFKSKIALLSVSISGLILLAFAFILLSAVNKFGLDRIDRELQTLGDVQVRDFRPHFFWAGFDEALSSIYGDNDQGPFLVKVNDVQNRSVYVSPHWPAFLTEKDLGEQACQGQAPVSDFIRPPRMGDFLAPVQISRLDTADKSSIKSLFERDGWRGLPPPPRMHMKPPRFITIARGAQTWRFVVMGNDMVTLMLGMDLADFHDGNRQFRFFFLVTTPVALLLLALGGWWLAGQALRPVKILTRVASGITAKGLDQRVRIAGADREFEALIDVLNGMLDRLEKSFQQAARFSADAAHELKTPLTILQGRLEQALQGATMESPEQCTYAELMEEVERLKVIVRKLLLLSQADAGQLKLSLQRVDLRAEIQDVVEDAQSLADGLAVTADLAHGIFVLADPILLRQALQNLATNAIKHNRPAGDVAFMLRQDGRQAVFTLANSMDPNVPIDRDRIFQRFYRADKSRGRKIDGVGLGLSLAREIFRAHRGDLVLRELEKDRIALACTLPLDG